jgi:hypothetical protein
MEKEEIPDPKLYGIILETKRHEETRRDEINKYYTSLFAALISIMPFIEKLISNEMHHHIQSYTIIIIMICLSVIGITISMSWILTLKRIFNYIEGFDRILIQIEELNHRFFIKIVSSYLNKINSPDRVTKQTMLLPTISLWIFILILIYNVIQFFLNFYS